jgi:hypothetical protein
MNSNDKPPFFKQWTGWYLSVVLFLLLLIGIFKWLTDYFS